MSRIEEHFISVEQQEQLQNEYQQKNYVFINRNRPANLPDSLLYTYDLDLLIEYMDYVKAESLKQDLENVKVRICMGQYPERDFDSRLNPAYVGYQTVFLSAVNELGEPIEGISAMDMGEVSPP